MAPHPRRGIGRPLVVELSQRVARFATVKIVWLQARPVVLLLIAASCVSIAMAIAAVDRFGQPFAFVIDASSVRHGSGSTYVWRVPDAGWFYQIRSDSPVNPGLSFMQLFEDGVALGPDHSSHSEIRDLGHGRFSHWQGDLLFSSSDNSSPSTNGKHYTVRVASSLAAGVRAIAVIHFLVGAALFALWLRSPDSPLRVALRPRFQSLYNWAGVPVLLSTGSNVSMLGAGGLAAALAVVFGWFSGETTQIGLSLGRYFPLSDALGYHSCAVSLAAWGRIESSPEFCGRRILYPSMLASLLSGLGWSTQLALVFQGLLTGFAAAAVTLQVARVTSATAALVVGGMLSVFVWEFTSGTFMTEVAGFTMGALGLCLLMAFAQSKRPAWLGCGMAFLSVGLTARAGAILVMPAVIAWIAIEFRRDDRLRKLLSIAILAALVGPFMQVAGAWSLGLDPANTGGNFSTELYALSTGSRRFSEAYDQFKTVFETRSEAEAFKVVYAAALENIRQRPKVFVGSLAAGTARYWNGLFGIGVLNNWSSWCVALFAIGALRGALFRRGSAASLLFAMFLGELATSPLIGNGGERVFASSIGVRLVLCAIGVQAVIDLLTYLWRMVPAPMVSMADGSGLLNLVSMIGLCVLASMAASFVPVGFTPRLQGVAPTGRCPNGLDEVISRIGGEAISFAILPDGPRPQTLEPMRIEHRMLQTAKYRATWYFPDIQRLRPPVTFVQALDRSTARAGSFRPLAYEGVLEPSVGPRILCVDRSTSIPMAGVDYAIIREVLPLHP